ncbi:MAG: hypothetical protein JXA18_12390, partial [Chitinispirillaceae bacterium]|nr:hypothetical protein [Chitinispirillaceae bacterium]
MAFGVILSSVILFADFLTGPVIRIPLLDIIPVTLMAWLGHSALAYAVAFLFSFARILFAYLWPGSDVLHVEIVNALLEVCALSLYALIFSKARTMLKVIALQREDIRHFHDFTETFGATMQGRAVSPGIAEGTAMIYKPLVPAGSDDVRIKRKDVEAEELRIDRAISAALAELKHFRKQLETCGSHKDMAFLDVRIAMLGDASLARECRGIVSTQLRSAEGAVQSEISRMELAFQKHEKAFMRARASDIRELGLLLLKNLRAPENSHPHALSSLQPKTIIVADDLFLYDALRMDLANVAAIVTEKTGPASHVAMLARARGIPAVCDIFGATNRFQTGVTLLVDGNEGSVMVGPTGMQAERVTL